MRWLAYIAGVVIISIIYSCMNDDQIEYRRAYTIGETLYYKHCQNCHGAAGEGLSALMPPLTDKSYLIKNKRQLACIIKNGSDKLLIINNKVYQNQMPPSGLAPVEIAQVLTYVNNTYGNKGGIVSLGTVNTDLQNCR